MFSSLLSTIHKVTTAALFFRDFLRLFIQVTLVSLSVFGLDVTAKEATDDWMPVKDKNLIIKAGSPLDFSRWIPSGPAGKLGRVVPDANGRMKFEQAQEPAILNCASLAWSPATGGFPDHTEADVFARQLRMHGYNVARFHYVDASLMDGQDIDFEFNKKQLDRWLYFLAALKREGIYWVMDAMSSENGAIGKVYPHRWVSRHDLKQQVHYSPVAQLHWRELTRQLFTIINPYTGRKILDDPALLGIILVNEGGLNFQALQHHQWPPELQPVFNRWLAKHYATTETLSKAWGDLNASESLEKNTVQLPSALRAPSARMTDFQRFLVDLEAQTAQWMKQYLRKLGYQGMVTSYNNWISTQADATRATLDWVDMHAYHDEAFSFSPGAEIKQTSSLDDFARYARWLAAARTIGKPYSVTEYGQPFWNRYRFETGLVVPAMAGLQGWDFICQHAEGAIDLSMAQNVPRKLAIHPYGIGIDPVARASETLAAILKLRGHVAPAKHSARLNFSGREFKDSGIDVVGDELSTLAWLTRIYNDAASIPSNFQENIEVMELKSEGGISIVGKVLDRLVGGSDVRLSHYVDLLRQQSVLPSGNLTDVKSGVFQSETGQILLDRGQGIFKVVTPGTEAVSFRLPSMQAELGVFKVINMSSEGLVSFSTLDDEVLAKSRKMLIIFITDAENTEMRFATPQRTKLVNLGKMPPRIRRGTVELLLKNPLAAQYSLHSLHLDGELGDRLEIYKTKEGLRFKIDNNVFSHGPTTYFLLEAK